MSGAAVAPAYAGCMLMGPTGAGKTDLAVFLAERLPLDIVSVDSAMVYRGMDIGTAKPNVDILARAPHRLIDMLDPAEAYSAGRFRREAQREIADIERRGRFPLLVGGTMMYFRVFQRGIAQLPGADSSLREALDSRAAREGWPALHAELAAVDARAARRIHPHDAQRIQRALEVHTLTGRALSDLQAETHGLSAERRWLKVALAPADRAVLHARVAERLDRMFADGLLEEVRALHERGDLVERMPSVRAVGYRQLWAYFDGRATRQAAAEAAVVATRQLAKRQLTWLRAEADVVWLDSQDRGRYTRALEQVTAAVMGGDPSSQARPPG